MAEMFGTPTGSRLAEQDFWTRKINQLQIQQTMGQLAAQPTERRLLEAQAGAAELQLKSAERYNTAIEENLKRQAAQVAGENAPIELDHLYNQTTAAAQLAFDAGFPERAAELAAEAANIQSRQATAANARSNQALHEYKLISDQANQFLNLLSSAVDQPSWDAAVAQSELITGEPSDLRGTTYDPAVVDNLSRQLMTAKERADLALRKEERASIDRVRKSNAELQKLREGLVRAQTTLARERAEKLKRDAGSGTAVAPTRVITAVVDRINNDFISPPTPEGARTMARPIAERAAEMMRNNPALRESEAVNRAYLEAYQSGTFQGLRLKGQPTDKELEKQKELASKYLQEYDPRFEYKETEAGLMRRPAPWILR